MDVQPFKDALLRKRTEILGTGGVKPLQASMENNTRQGDMADQASGNNEVHIQLKLKQTDAKILQAIEEALLRLDKGSYGVCRDCGEPIAEARLNAIPWTASALPAKRSRIRELARLGPGARRGVPSREACHDAPAHRPCAAGGAVRREQHLSVRHQPGRRPAVVAVESHCRSGRRGARARRTAGCRCRFRQGQGSVALRDGHA